MEDILSNQCLAEITKFKININGKISHVSNVIQKEIKVLRIGKIHTISFSFDEFTPSLDKFIIEIVCNGTKNYRKLIRLTDLISIKIGNEDIHYIIRQTMHKIDNFWKMHNPQPKWSVFYFFAMSSWTNINCEYDKKRNDFLLNYRERLYSMVLQHFYESVAVCLLQKYQIINNKNITVYIKED